MRMFLLSLSFGIGLIIFSENALADDCTGPALWRISGNGNEMIVLREGSGRADFHGDGNQLPAIALEVIYTTHMGEKGHGTLWGPIRSYMFMAPPVAVLDELGFTWQLPSEDESGHYTARSDDGKTVLMHMTFERCL